MWHAHRPLQSGGPPTNLTGQTSVTRPMTADPRLWRHVAACNTARLEPPRPGGRLAFRIGAARVGWVSEPLAAMLADFAGVTLDRSGVGLVPDAAADLPAMARSLADEGAFRWRGEAFDVRVTDASPPLATIDRGALPAFGLLSLGVHLNGLVRRPDGFWLWVGRRAPDKALDPNKLDHLVAGGVSAGLSPWRTLLKEAAEEASMPEAVAARAHEVARIGYAMERPEGLRRDRLICYDVVLPDEFVPRPGDDEVVAFELWPMARVVRTVRDTADFKFNVNLVLLDLFQRLRLA